MPYKKERRKLESRKYYLKNRDKILLKKKEAYHKFLQDVFQNIVYLVVLKVIKINLGK